MVRDAQPLLVLFHKQSGWQSVDQFLDQAVANKSQHLMSAINFGEIYYTLLGDYGEDAARRGMTGIRLAPIRVELPSLEQVLLAGRFKAGGGISYADCFAGALALEHDVPVLTGDKEFERLIPFGVKIEWLPSNK